MLTRLEDIMSNVKQAGLRKGEVPKMDVRLLFKNWKVWAAAAALIVSALYLFNPISFEKMTLLHEGNQLIFVLALILFFIPPVLVSNRYQKLMQIIQSKDDEIARLEKMSTLATHDALTGIGNRRDFDTHLQTLIARSRRTHGHFALLFIDMDNFKSINDHYGHYTGDEALRECARRLQHAVRDGDKVCRLGGDEFVVTLEEVGEPEAALITARRIIESFEWPLLIDGHEIEAGISIGISIFPENGEDANSLIASADIAMYQAKQEGKGRFVFCTRQMETQMRQLVETEEALKHALENDEFELYYQPQINMNDHEIPEAEALIRWNKANGSVVSASEFMATTEKTGLIIPIGEWVLRKACEQSKIWEEQARPTKLAINISLRQLMHKEFALNVQRIIAQTGANPQLIEFEVNESILMHSSEQTLRQLTQLKKIGIAITIDDFGKNYASVSYIKQYPIDKIKLDRSLIRDAMYDPQGRDLVAALTALGHAMKLTVIAEGIEYKAQMQLSRELKLDMAQGFYFSQPLKARAFARFNQEYTLSA